MAEVGVKVKKRIWKTVIILFWVALWEALSRLVNNPLLFAGPWDTFLRLCKDVAGLGFWLTVGFSICRILAGFVLGILLGSLFGIFSYKWKLIKEFMAPVMHFSKAVPVASFVVVLLIWWGSDFLSTASCFLVVLPMAYVNFLEGLEHTDRKLLEMAEVYCMPMKNRIFYIYRPALLPFLEGCMSIALGMGIKSGIAAEVIGISNYSIGGEMYLSKIYLDTAGVFSWTAVVILISVMLEKAMQMCLHHFYRWTPKITRDRLRRIAFEDIQLINISKKFCDEGSKYISKAISAKDKRNTDNKKIKDINTENSKYTVDTTDSVENKYCLDNSVLKGIHKDLKNGDIVCLMAPSGYGKTTLLHILAGILNPDEGKILITNKDKGPEDIRLHVGIVFQEDRLCEELNAIMNLELISSDWDKVKACLEELLPSEALTMPVKNLSGGMRRRVCIARALVSNTDYLLLDEPFSGLDWETRNSTIEVILKYREGRLLLVATHEEEDAEKFSGRVWRLDGYSCTR